MGWSFVTATAMCLGWMISPDVLVRLGNGVGTDRTLFLAALALAVLLTARGMALIRHPQLRRDGRCSRTGLLVQGIGRLPAASLILASRLTTALLLPTGLLVAAGFAFNEIFLYWFPNFGFAFLLLALITLIHLSGARLAAAIQPILAGLCLVCLLILCLAGLGGPASNRPVSMDVGFSLTPEVAAGALLLFLGTDSSPPARARDSRVPGFASLFLCLVLFVLWAMVSLQYAEGARLADTTIPHLIVAREILGEPGRVLMGCIIISGSCAAVNALFQLTLDSLAELAERGLLPGHRPDQLRRRRYVLILALAIGGLMLGGLAGHDIIESYIQASLLLWFLLFAMFCLAAGRILQRNGIPGAWHGHALAALFIALIAAITAFHQESALIIRFQLLTLMAAAGATLFWQRQQPACDVISQQSTTKGDTS